jgi:hypothetical protein
MKNKNGNARIIAKLHLDLSILEHQERLWQLRAKAKRLRITEVERQIRVKSGNR